MRYLPNLSLKTMAECGYIMGLSTIGEVASHMRSHYDAYFSIEHLAEEEAEFDSMVASHEDENIDLWLTDDDKRKLDEELEATMAASTSEDDQRDDELREASDETEDEGEEENKHF